MGMMGAGYSKKTLVEKLGIKPGYRVALINPPADYDATLGKLPDRVAVSAQATGKIEFIQCFVMTQHELHVVFDDLKESLLPAGMLWISWPKKASKLPTDLDENIIREFGLAHGLVDVKVCAVDETWSGLKFVYRLKDR